LSWSPDGGYKIAITYCDTNFRSSTRHLSTNSYIWETENPNQPLHKLTSLSPSICIEYQQKEKDINVLVSGQLNGQCCAWDVRAGCEPVSCTPREICHRESANRVLWINSKTGTEFFSGGADGQVIWWDMRKLNERLDFLYMDPEKSDEQVLERSYGVSVLEYETTIPTRFMVGSEQGMLFFCNRKGKTPLEKITLRVRDLIHIECFFFFFFALFFDLSLDHFINIFLFDNET
jgi:dynein intermediate chain 2, axonemal